MVYLLTFCQIVIGLVFLVSALGKIQDFKAFELAIQNFNLIPSQFISISSKLFLLGELIVVGCMVVGIYIAGFLIGAILLIIFTLALVSVLSRKIKTACNCFGPSTKLVSWYDVLRNIGLILCSVIGLFTSYSLMITPQNNLNIIEWGMSSLIACVFSLVWLNLRDIFEFLRQ